MLDPFFGVISEQVSDTDFQLLAGVVDLPNPRHDYWTNQIQYDQTEVAPNSCTIHGSLGAVSSLSGHTFTLDQRKQMWQLALAQGADPSVGWYINKAVDLVRQIASDILKEEFSTFRVALSSQEFVDNLKKGYCAVVGFRGNAQYNADKNDGILDETKLVGDSSYGHCVRMVISQDPSYAKVIVDNYPQSGHNTYKIPFNHMAGLIDSGVFFKDAYFFAYKADMTSTPSLISPWAVNSVEKAKKYGILDWSAPQEIVGDAVAEAILIKLGGLTSTVGVLSKERLIVALDRLKAIP